MAGTWMVLPTLLLVLWNMTMLDVYSSEQIYDLTEEETESKRM